MINLIERFFEETEKMNVYAVLDKEINNAREVYFFLGRKSVLCIDKKEDRIIYNIDYNKLQIHILNATEFCFHVEGKVLSFYQDSKMPIAKNFSNSSGNEKLKRMITMADEAGTKY